MEFTVRVDCGDVYINDVFVSQLCFDNESIGCAVSEWLNGLENDET